MGWELVSRGARDLVCEMSPSLGYKKNQDNESSLLTQTLKNRAKYGEAKYMLDEGVVGGENFKTANLSTAHRQTHHNVITKKE